MARRWRQLFRALEPWPGDVDDCFAVWNHGSVMLTIASRILEPGFGDVKDCSAHWSHGSVMLACVSRLGTTVR